MAASTLWSCAAQKWYASAAIALILGSAPTPPITLSTRAPADTATAALPMSATVPASSVASSATPTGASAIVPTPSPSALPSRYALQPLTPTATSAYPGPGSYPTPGGPTATPPVAPTVPIAAAAISPDNAASLRLTAPLGAPSFRDLKQYFANNSDFAFAPAVLGAAFSPDGTRLAVWQAYGVFVYDWRARRPLHFIDTGYAFPFAVSLLADDRTLMVSDGENAYFPLGATFFDTVTGQRQAMVRVPWPQPPTGTFSRLSPDTRTLVIQQGLAAWLYDAFTRQRLLFWPDRFPLAGYRFSPDGRLLAAGSGAVTVWEVSTHRVYFNATPVNTAAVEVPAMTFSADGRLFATTDWRRVIVWDVSRKQLLFDVPVTDSELSVNSALTFAADDRTLVLTNDPVVLAWRVPSGQAALRTAGTGAAFSPDGATLLITTDRQTTQVWDVATLRQRFELAGGGPQYGPDGRLLIQLGGTSYAFADPTTGKVQPAFDAVRPHFAPDGQLFDIADDGSLRLLDSRGDLVQSISLRPAHSPMTSLAFLNDGRLAMAFGNGTVRLETSDPQEANDPFAAAEQGAWIYQIAPAPDGTSILSASQDGTVARLVDGGDLASVDPVTFGGQPGELTSVAISPNGLRLAAGGSDGTVKLWDAANPAITPTQTLAGPTNWVWSVDFSPDGRQLASGSADQTVRLWDLATGATVHVLTGHTGAVHSVVYSPDGSLVATGAWDGTVRLWDSASGALVRILNVETGRVNQVAFSRDGRVLAAAVDDGTVRLWDSATGGSLAILHPAGGAVWAIAFSPDGRRLAAAMNDGNAQVWQAP